MFLLQTSRLLFRQHTIGDLDAFCAMEADPEVRRYVGGAPRTREAAESKFRRAYLPAIRDRMGMWATVLKSDDSYVGYCGVYPHVAPGGPIPGEGTLGYYLARPYWRRGLASEAAAALVDFAFRELALSRIVAGVEVGNEVSARILSKLGFTVFEREIGPRTFDNFELRCAVWGG